MKRNRKSIIKRNKYLVFLAIIFLIYVSSILIRQEIQYKKLKEEEAIYLKEIQLLNTKIKKLEVKLESNQDLQIVEKVAREKLKMVKPNEIIYIIQED